MIYKPIYYLRSQLCRTIVYTWDIQGTLQAVDSSIDFASGRPEGASEPNRFVYLVTYPEEAVLAYYPEGQVEEIIDVTPLGEQPILVKVKIKGNEEVMWRLVREDKWGTEEIPAWRLSP